MKDHKKFKSNQLISIDDLDREDINILYEVTQEFKQVLEGSSKKVNPLKNLTIANLFFEESTRTRVSFELAEKRLSAEIVNFSSGSSSLKKGETLLDTVNNILAMKVDIIVVRDKHSGTPAYLSQKIKVPIINAGDGTNEHPTQALLDLFTLWEKGLNEKNSRIILIGDILHSRVAGSSIKLWNKIGIKYQLEGPKTIQRKSWKENNLDDYYENSIIYCLRIQNERLNKDLIPSLEEYHQNFGVKFNKSKGKNWIMHPGPINRGVEIDSESADSHKSLIMAQVEMGVALRMAILYLLAQKKRG